MHDAAAHIRHREGEAEPHVGVRAEKHSRPDAAHARPAAGVQMDVAVGL